MIAQANRFHGHGSLRFTLRRAKTERTPYFKLKHIAHPKRKTWRLAIVVSKKVNKSAVVRNRIRRRLYEVFRTNMPAMTIQPDLIIIVLDDKVLDYPHQDLLDICQPLFRKLADCYNHRS